MKKIIATAAAALLLALSASAQPFSRPHFRPAPLCQEVGFSYGVGPYWAMSHRGQKSTFDGYSLRNFKNTGAYSLDYSYSFRNFQLGAALVYSYSNADEYYEHTQDLLFKSNAKFNNFTLLAFGKLCWFDADLYRFYSKAGLGCDFIAGKNTDGLRMETELAFQLTPIGAEVGNIVKAFAEVGYGSQGILLAGLRYRF